ncbi:O-acyltransferase like protein-like [Neocloeon triangulifer]|uniref:O-acyltransferase like protein-like n=1 Tax=Neocloeon triangulifer TaxID=2078957 RepID=UPI00286F3299|nr:O-acyltransferase like protein-like [Neocloeon triangulifer]
MESKVLAALLIFTINGISAQLVNPQCLLDVAETLRQASQERAEWALRMIDATTKFPDGIMVGNLDNMGHWDECLEADSGTGISGKYCRVGVSFQNPASSSLFNNSALKKFQSFGQLKSLPDGVSFSLRVALCLPKSCEPADFEIISSQLVPVFDPNTQVSTSVNPSECYTLETVLPEIGGGTIAAIVVFSLLIGLVFVATILENFKKGGPIINALSARTTYSQLVSVKEGAFDCVNGIKVLSMLWIMMGHRYELGVLSTPTSNRISMFDLTQEPLYMALGNAFLSVDTFFLIGGFLLAFGFFRDMKKGNKFDAIKFYVYRYLRLTVPILVMIVFYLTILRFMGAGPVWYSSVSTRFVGTCETHWWAAITYVNNYVSIMSQCVEQTWYTSVDMQLAWLSPLLLLPMHFSPRAGKQLAFIVILISCAIPAVLTYLNNYPWSVNMVNADYYDVLAYTVQVYLATHSRASPYLVGIVLGYIMVNCPKKMYFNWKTVALGWLLSAGICLTVVFTLSITYKYDYVYEPIAATFYGGLHRLAWAIGLSWVIFACTKGIGGPVNSILSWRFFSILSPLIYGVYLVHFMVIGVQVGAKKQPDYASHYDVIHNFFGDIPFSFAGGSVIYFVVEAPLMVFLRQIFKKQKPTVNGKSAEKKEKVENRG